MISISLFYYCERYLALQIHSWLGKFNETSLPAKEDFYNHLNMKDITDADYAHTKTVC